MNIGNHRHLSIDVALTGLGTVGTFLLRDNLGLEVFSRPGLGLYLMLTLLFSALLYSASRISTRVWRYFSFVDVVRIAVVTGVIVLLAWSFTFLIDRTNTISRVVPPLQWALITALLFSARSAVRLLTESGRSPLAPKRDQQRVRNVLVVGVNDIAELYMRCVDRLAEGSVAVVGILDENDSVQNRALKSAQVLGKPENIRDIVNLQAIHGVHIEGVVVTVPFPGLSEKSRCALRAFSDASGRPLELFEERLGLAPPPEATAEKVSAIAYRAYAASSHPLYGFVKRAIDVTGALVLILLLLPLTAIVSLMTLADLGLPIYFWQVRPGLRGRSFRVLKFRTMRGAHDVDGHRIPDEQRSTVLGEALRRFRLDELPQLFNILIGDMSFVGPRPLLPVDQAEFAQVRLSLRPGLTGWAQVNGGRSLSVEDKMDLDIWYVRNMSLLLDIKIVLKTFNMLLFGESPPQSPALAEAKRIRGTSLSPKPVVPRPIDSRPQFVTK